MSNDWPHEGKTHYDGTMTNDKAFMNIDLPAANPTDPATCLLRAVFGVCPDHDECTPADHPETQIRVTEWDDTNGGFIFEVDDHGYVGYVKRFTDGTYLHYDRGFQTVTLPSDIASRREICVASYMANNERHFR